MTVEDMQAIDALDNGEDGRHGASPRRSEVRDSSARVVVAHDAPANVC
ncbi:hypothetical protein [Curtobacterium flaccumfaciens]